MSGKKRDKATFENPFPNASFNRPKTGSIPVTVVPGGTRSIATAKVKEKKPQQNNSSGYVISQKNAAVSEELDQVSTLLAKEGLAITVDIQAAATVHSGALVSQAVFKQPEVPDDFDEYDDVTCKRYKDVFNIQDIDAALSGGNEVRRPRVTSFRRATGWVG